MKSDRRRLFALLVLLGALAPGALSTTLRAQSSDRLRVLRFDPAGPEVGPLDPLVIAFDHPVAPRLDASVKPDRAVRITPAVRTHSFWRDPSTLVVEFLDAWPYGTTYRVDFDPKLRSESGVRLAADQSRELRVHRPRLLAMAPTTTKMGRAAVMQEILVAYEAALPLLALVDRASIVPTQQCARFDPIALSPQSIRPLQRDDPAQLRNTPMRDADLRLDTLRRVVRFVADRALPRSCRALVRIPTSESGRETSVMSIETMPTFSVDSIGVVSGFGPHGHIKLHFSLPVSVAEIAKNVTVNGHASKVQPPSPFNRISLSSEGSSSSWILADSIPPGGSADVSIGADLTTLDGERLGATVRRGLLAPHATPSVDFSLGQVLIPKDAGVLLVLRHVNTDSLMIVIGRVADSLRGAALGAQRYGSFDMRGWSALVSDTLVRVIASPAPMDSQAVRVLLTSLLPAEWRDEPLLVVRASTMVPTHPTAAPPVNRAPPFAVVQRSNLAAHAVMFRGRTEVWVTSLRTAQPVAGAQVRVMDPHGRVLASTRTDARGRAALDYDADAQSTRFIPMLDVSRGADRILLALPQVEPADRDDDDDGRYGWWDRGLREISSGRELHGAAFSERGIYRPGERVFLKGVVRTVAPKSTFATPAGDSARWTIVRLDDHYNAERVARHATILSSFGTSVDTFDIPRTAQLGRHDATLALKTSTGWRTAAHVHFTVAEYRPVEFNLALDADTSAVLFVGDTARVRAKADYLFGMPMAGGKVRWSSRLAETSPWERSAAGLDGFTVGRSWWRLPEGLHPDQQWVPPDSATLDADGRAPITIPIGSVTRMARLTISASAEDANRQTVTGERILTVHAADAYVGIRQRSPRWTWSVGDSISLELLVARADGRRREGTPIQLVAQRYEWTSGNAWRVDTVWRAETRSAGEPVRAVFAPASIGWYEILATVHDEQGRASTSGLDLWVTGGAGVKSARSMALEIRPELERYAPGDVATVVIVSPVEQQAWVTLSRSAPLDEQLVALHAGANVVKVPIPVEAMPAAEVRVIGVAPLGSALSDRSSYLGTATRSIQVSTRSRELTVAVRTDRARYAPGEEVRVAVSVRDTAGRGRRAETAIWAVDEGVGLLTGLAKPELLTALMGAGFLAPWQGSSLLGTVLGLSPEFWKMSENVMVRVRGVSTISGRIPSMMLEEVVTVGYGTQPADASVRMHFATTPFFAGTVVTDSNGVAEVRFTLPDNVTTYRLFATAVTEGTEVGAAMTSLVSTRPLIVRAALPRAVRLGDTLLAGGVLTQDADGSMPVSLRIEGRGIDVSGSLTRTDTLRGRTANELRFPMRVVSGDSVTVRLTGGSARDGDAVQLTLPVSPAGHARAHVVAGSLETHAAVSLPIIDGIDIERSRVAVQLGTSLLPLVRQIDQVLRLYPYYCTEQLSSGARVLLARVALERAIDPSIRLADRDRRQLELAVSQILARQQEGGGFGYWDRSGWTSPWLTAYALDALLSARDEGIVVPESALQRAAAYLRGTIVQDGTLAWWNAADSVGRTHDALVVARTLRRLGTPDTTLERGLTKFRDVLGYVDRLDLAMLRATVGDSVDARALVAAAWRSARASGRKIVLDDSTRGTGWLFESRLRPMARLLAATAILEPRHPLLGALLESLAQGSAASEYWQWNTLDQSATADALVAARAVYGFGEARQVTVRGPSGVIAQATFEAGRSDSVGMPLSALLSPRRADATPRLTLDADTRKPIYYAATLFETPRARPVRGDDEGISVERWYESYDDAKPIISAREGQLVRVRLRITVRGERDFVAIEDPLPVGLEAVDLSLRTSSTLAPFAGAPKRPTNGNGALSGRWAYGTWDGGWWSPWEHKEIRDDRVLYFARRLWTGSFDASYVARATTVGTFVRPPAWAEEMYNPAVHGRSDGGVFTVTEAARTRISGDR